MEYNIRKLKKLVKELNAKNTGLIFSLKEEDDTLILENVLKNGKLGESFGIYDYIGMYGSASDEDEDITREQVICECAYFIKGIMAGIEINDEKSYVYFLTKRVR